MSDLLNDEQRHQLQQTHREFLGRFEELDRQRREIERQHYEAIRELLHKLLPPEHHERLRDREQRPQPPREGQPRREPERRQPGRDGEPDRPAPHDSRL